MCMAARKGMAGTILTVSTGVMLVVLALLA